MSVLDAAPLLQETTEEVEKFDKSAERPDASKQTLRILLIDDDDDCFVIAQHFLSQSGVAYVLEWRSTYQAGLQALREEQLDACLLDYHLGARDGLELLREAIAQGCRVPIIMLTGQGDQRIDIEMMKAGASDYLIKDTLDPSRLERSIRYAIERKRLLNSLRVANDTLEARVQDRTMALRESEAELRIALDHKEVALKEKELLLRELHHRVKNNLQIINSILSLQCSRIEDRASKELFKECQNRVRTIALVHDKLHNLPNLACIDLASYLRDLVDSLVRCYSVNPEAVTAKIVVDEKIALGFDHLIPSALIVNELVCNALKYAFPEGRSGEIRVELRQKDGQINLIVADNGVGFPTPETRRGGTGQQIVQALVEQLSGKLERVNEWGSNSTEISFAEPSQ